jgi:hypothetical protein
MIAVSPAHCRFFFDSRSMSISRRLRRYTISRYGAMPFAPLPLRPAAAGAKADKRSAPLALPFSPPLLRRFFDAAIAILFSPYAPLFSLLTPRPDYFRRLPPIFLHSARHAAMPPFSFAMVFFFRLFFDMPLFSPPPCRLFSLSHFVFAIA